MEGTWIFIYLIKFFKTFTLKIKCHQLHHPRWSAYLRYAVFSACRRSSDGRFLSPELLFDSRKRWRHKSCCWVSKMLVNKKKKLNSGLMVSSTEVIKNPFPIFFLFFFYVYFLNCFLFPYLPKFFFFPLTSILLSSFFHSSTDLYILQ